MNTLFCCFCYFTFEVLFVLFFLSLLFLEVNRTHFEKGDVILLSSNQDSATSESKSWLTTLGCLVIKCETLKRLSRLFRPQVEAGWDKIPCCVCTHRSVGWHKTGDCQWVTLGEEREGKSLSVSLAMSTVSTVWCAPPPTTPPSAHGNHQSLLWSCWKAQAHQHSRTAIKTLFMILCSLHSDPEIL